MGQAELPVGLLPVYPNTAWECCLLQAIAYLQRNWRRFCRFGPFKKCGSCSGASGKYLFRNKKLLTKGRGSRSCDNGAVFEVFLIAWKLWMGLDYEKDRDLSYEHMDELLRRCFFVDSIDIYISEYPLGFISGLLKIPSWLSWFTPHGCSVKEIKDPRDLRFGDFCRIREGKHPREGQTVLVLGEGWEKGHPVIYTWSSHGSYDNDWDHSYDNEPGYGCSFVYLNKKVNGRKRFFYGARLVDSSGPVYRFASQIISQ